MFRKLSLVLIGLLSFCVLSFSAPPYFLSENAITKDRDFFSFSVFYKEYGRIMNDFLKYSFSEVTVSLEYSPNKNSMFGIRLPYEFMPVANDFGFLGDIKLFSKFVVYDNILNLRIDEFFLSSVLILNADLGSGIRKEDGYRNIGLQKGLYYPISSGYFNLVFGNATTFVGEFLGLSLCFLLNFDSSKIEPPLAFNLENDYVFLGGNLEFFILSAKDFQVKLFLENTYVLPFYDKAKFIPSNFLGFGVWTSFYNFVLKGGYFVNTSFPSDVERFIGNMFFLSFEIR